jgi:hypothetical protein
MRACNSQQGWWCTLGASDLGGASSAATAACGRLSSPFPTSAGRIDDSLVAPREGSKENEIADPALVAAIWPFSWWEALSPAFGESLD